MQVNKNNQFTMSTGMISVTEGLVSASITLDVSNHPPGKNLVVIPTALGDVANVNVYVKSQNNSTGRWVITFELSGPAVTTTKISYVAYSSTV